MQFMVTAVRQKCGGLRLLICVISMSVMSCASNTTHPTEPSDDTTPRGIRSSPEIVMQCDSDEAFLAILRSPEATAVTLNERSPLSVSIRMARYWNHVRIADEASREMMAFKFVGFVEGISSIQVPDWWIERIRTVYVAEDNTRFPVSVDDSWFKVVNRSLRFVGEGHPSLDGNGDLMIENSNGTCNVSLKEKYAPWPSMRRISFACGSDYVVSCSFGPMLAQNTVLSHDRKDGRLRWSAAVWASPLWHALGGQVPMEDHRLEVSIQKGRVLVFGACIDAVYCEGFSEKDGLPLFRFCSNLQEKQRSD